MKKINDLSILPFMLLFMFFTACNPMVKDELIPVLTTITQVSAITQTTATCGGNITSDAGSSVTARGVCWSTKANPTIADSKTSDGVGTGSFISAITGLNVGTTYFVRAYATNNVGTGYGSAYSFATPLFITFNPNLTYGSVKDIDGNIYKTITIGTQTWMAENLRTSKYRNGVSIPNVKDDVPWTNLTTGAWCNYNNDAANDLKYGKLYNWYAASDSRNIAPVGWHVPTDAEWTNLITFLGGVTVAGGKLKEVGTVNWNSPNTSASNESGFSAIPGGRRNYEGNGEFEGLGSYGYWLSSNNDIYAWYAFMYNKDSRVSKGSQENTGGCSVRCVKD